MLTISSGLKVIYHFKDVIGAEKVCSQQKKKIFYTAIKRKMMSAYAKVVTCIIAEYTKFCAFLKVL